MNMWRLVMIFGLVGVIEAYPPYILYPVRSAVGVSGQVVFQVDFTSNAEPGEVLGGSVYVRGSDGVVRSISLVRVSASGDYQYTYEASTTISTTSPTDAYFMFYDDTTIATQSFKNASSAFPPPSYCWARAAFDPTGDLENDITDTKLDITGLWTTYSDTRLYFKVSHAGGDWNVGGLWPPYFSWACYVINPDAPSDTIYYALLYCKNVPGVIGVGLWRFTRSGDFTKIADIQSQVANDSLVLSCSIDTLSADPYFGPWPNSSGYLIVGVRTDKAVSLTSTLRADVTANQKFYPSTMTINPSLSNTPPYISSPGVSGGKTTYTYNITVNYQDADNNLPVVRKVIANGVEFDMTTQDHRYNDGAIFRATVNLENPLMTLGFRFFDGRDSSNSLYLLADERSHNPAEFLFVKAYPNPFNDACTIEIFSDAERKPIEIKIYDIYGSLRDEIKIGIVKSGANIVKYRPRPDMPSGIYFYRVDGSGLAGSILYMK